MRTIHIGQYLISHLFGWVPGDDFREALELLDL